ncbi:MAG: exopolysaccharide biosynthesis polyprenyl glycosylphosphotransferase [Nocardioidaceae bacterium]
MSEGSKPVVQATAPDALPADPEAVEVVDERVVAGPGIGFLGRRDPSLRHQHLNLAARNLVATLAGVVTALTVPAASPRLVLVAVVAGLLLHLFAVQLPTYEREASSTPSRRLTTLGVAVALVCFTLAVAPPEVIRSAMVVGAVVAAVGWASSVLMRLRRGESSALIIGDRMSVYHLVNQWKRRSEIDIVGICLAEADDDTSDTPSEVMGIPVVGRLGNTASLAVAAQVAQVVVAPGPTLTAYDVRRLSWALEDTTIELSVAAEVHGALPHRISPRLLGRRLLLSVRPSKRSAVATGVKAVLDRVLGLLLLVLFAPLIGLLVLAVRLDSPGPGLFRQQRAGKDGHLFWMYKARTMTVDAEERRAEILALNEGAGPLFKMRVDPRVTRVGDVLRKTSLDELPQLINVVRGEMSLIGPRPALPSEIEQYDDWVRRRLSVKPGMTGLWQVSGRSDLPWQESVRLDLDYVDNWTTGSDLGIVARTIKAVVRRDGAV